MSGPAPNQHYPQPLMTPTQARPASNASVAGPSGSRASSDAAHFTVPPARNNSDTSVQPARRSEAPLSELITAFATYGPLVPIDLFPVPRQPMTGGPGASRDPRLRSKNVQTTTPPVPTSPAPPRAAAYDSHATLSACSSHAGSSVSLGSSRNYVHVNTATDTPMSPTLSLENMEITMARLQRRKRSSDEATGEGRGVSNIRAAMTSPAPNESRAKDSKQRKSVGSSKTPAESSIPRAPTSSVQPPTTGQPHPQHQMTPAQARPASSASVTAPSGSSSPPLDNLDTMLSPNIRVTMTGLATNESRITESKEGKYVGSSITPAKSSKPRAPTSSAQPPTTGQRHPQYQMTPAQARPASYASVAAPSGFPQPTAFVSTSTFVIPAPHQPMTGGVSASRDPRLRAKNVQTTTPPVPISPAPPRAAAYDSHATLSACSSHAGSSVSLGSSRNYVHVNTATDTPMSPTLSLENMEITMARLQRRKRSSDEATGEGRGVSNIRAAMTGPAPNESRAKDSKQRKCVGSSKTPAESSIPRAPTSSVQPPTTGQPHPQHQMTPAQARPASSASVTAPSGSSSPSLDNLDTTTSLLNILTGMTGPAPNESRAKNSKQGKCVGSSKTPAESSIPRVPTSSAQPPTTGQPHPQQQMTPAQAQPASSASVTAPSGASSPPLDNLDTTTSLLNILTGMTGPAPNESRAKNSKQGKCVGSSKTPAESSIPRVPTSSAQPPTTGQPHPQQQMTPAQAQPASSASVTAPSGASSPPLDNLDTTTSLLNILTGMTGPAPNESRAKNSKQGKCVGSSKTPAESSIPRVPTSSAQPPTTGQPHPQQQMTPAQAQPASSASVTAPSGASSPPLDNLDTTTSLLNILTGMTGPAPNESRAKNSKQGKCVGSSKTPAKSSKPRAPTSSAQPPTTGQPHPLHQMTPAQARPASYASVAAPSGSPQPVVSPTATAHFTVPPARKNSDPSVQPARRSEAPRSEPAASFALDLTAKSSKPRAPTSSVQPQTTGQPHPLHQMTPAQARPASYASVAAPSGSPQPVVSPTATAHFTVPPARKNSDPSVQPARRSEAPRSEPAASFALDLTAKSSIPRAPTSSAQPPTTSQPHPLHQRTPAQARPASSASVTAPSGSSSPPLDNLDTTKSLPNILPAMTGPAPNESRAKNSNQGKCVGSSKTPAESSIPRAPTSSAQPPTTGQPHPQQQMTPAQAQPASSASVTAPSGASSPPLDNLDTDEKKPLKKKKKLDKELETLNKKSATSKAKMKKWDTRIKEIKMLQMKENVKKRMERRKLLNERDQKTIRRIDENLKQLTDQ